MHGNAIAISADLPVIVADYLAETDVLVRPVVAFTRLVASIPLKLAAWLGPELRTPENSPPPRVIPAELGPWTGVIFVVNDEPRFWVFAKAAGRPSREPMPSPSAPFGPPYDGRYGGPPGSPGAPAVWPEDAEPEWYGPPLEPRPWRGGS